MAWSIVLTEDGMFASVTDYGNLSYAWRSFGNDDFRQFLCSINMGYFATKMYGGIAYVSYGKKFEQACNRYAEMILPALQTILLSELENGIQW